MSAVMQSKDVTDIESIDVEMTEVEAPEGPISDERALQLASAAHAAASDYFDTNVRADIERDLGQWHGEHPRDSKYRSASYAGRSKIYSSKTRAATIKAEAAAAEAFFSSVEVVNVTADDKDDPQAVASAAYYRALLQKRLADSNPKTSVRWFQTLLGSYQEAQVIGVTISRQRWEHLPLKRISRPAIDLIPAENFEFDPASDWRDPVATSPYLINKMPLYVKDIREKIAARKYLPVPDSVLQTAGSQEWDSIRLARGRNRTDDKDIAHEVTDFSIVWVHENIMEIDGVDYVFDTLGVDHLLTRPIPLEERYVQGRPFAIGFTTIEAHKHYPSGTPRLTRDLIREHNEIRNKRIDFLDIKLNPRYLGARNRQIDIGSLTRFMPGGMTLVQDTETDVKILDTGQVPPAAFQEVDQMAVEFDDMAGQFSNSSVQNNRELNETVGGMNRIAANADQVTAYRLKTFVETWAEPCLRQVVTLLRIYESDERIMAAALMASGAEILDDALLDGEHTLQINVGMGVTSPTEKANLLLFGLTSIQNLLADGVLKRHGLNVKEAIKEVFAMLGWRDGSRFFTFAEDDPVVSGLLQEIESMEQQLAAKMPPELLKATVDKLAAETVVKMVEAVYSSVQAGQAIATVPTLAPTADEILKSAGFVDKNPAPILLPPAGPTPGLLQEEVGNDDTGVKYLPGDPTGAGMEQGGNKEEDAEADGDLAAGNTNPMQPKPPAKPPGPGQGMKQGIETQRNDGAQPNVP